MKRSSGSVFLGGEAALLEIEQKYRVEDASRLVRQLERINASERDEEFHVDTYYAHPCRDFRESGEALRIRRVNNAPMVTYKGPKLPGDVKARQELEWRLDPGDRDGSHMMELLNLLGFEEVATVRKTRRVFFLSDAEITLVIDQVDLLGCFAEIERVIADVSLVETAREMIKSQGIRLGLEKKENRSYLGMLLELPNR
ncbi:MAG: class IV adenylate cyclase [Rubripirellula sp.]